jgi:hypothetical protein
VTTDQPHNETAPIRAPWTNEQVSALNRYQRDGWMHPFNCPNEHPGDHRKLTAIDRGWRCPEPGCDYRQDWAHAFMADPDAWPKPFHRTDLGTEFVRQADHPDPDALDRLEGALGATAAPDDGHVCKPGASIYYCPTGGEAESDCHGGFDVCCDRPDLHQPLPRPADEATSGPTETCGPATDTMELTTG